MHGRVWTALLVHQRPLDARKLALNAITRIERIANDL
jgi:hypothetical protein